LNIPKLFIYGQENSSLSYIPELRKNNMNVKEISMSNHFVFYDNPKELYDVIGAFIDDLLQLTPDDFKERCIPNPLNPAS
jgi:hypothetical protein